MSESIAFHELPEDEQVAAYGAMFAIAAADGVMDREELVHIFETLDLSGLGEAARRRVRAFLVDPPSLPEALEGVREASEPVRFGVMLHLTDVALADGVIVDDEAESLALAREVLGVSQAQADEMVAFLVEVRRIRARGLDDSVAAEAFKKAASSLSAVGVPIGAVYFSGSVIGLSAAGITSGLAAVGLGFGMVPGIGMLVLIGVGTHMAVGWALGRRKKQRETKQRLEGERRAQRVILNLQEAIDHLVERITDLQVHAETAEANAEAVRILTARLTALKGALARREQDQAEGLA